MLKRNLMNAAVPFAAAIAGAGAWALVAHFSLPTRSEAVEKLLQLKLPESNGKIVDFAQWRGKPLVVNFWATWCAPCREEMPMLGSSARATPSVSFVGVSVDDKDHVAEFSSKNPTTYPLPIAGMELSALIGELGNKAMALPFTAFIRADGTVQKVKLGALKSAELEGELQQLKATIKAP